MVSAAFINIFTLGWLTSEEGAFRTTAFIVLRTCSVPWSLPEVCALALWCLSRRDCVPFVGKTGNTRCFGSIFSEDLYWR